RGRGPQAERIGAGGALRRRRPSRRRGRPAVGGAGGPDPVLLEPIADGVTRDPEPSGCPTDIPARRLKGTQALLPLTAAGGGRRLARLAGGGRRRLDPLGGR